MAEMVLPPAPPNMTYKVEKLNPLAFPKGMDLRCELTGKPALVRPHGSKRPHEAPTRTMAQESHGPRERPRRAAREPLPLARRCESFAWQESRRRAWPCVTVAAASN